jgi:hypothetical protein
MSNPHYELCHVLSLPLHKDIVTESHYGTYDSLEGAKEAAHRELSDVMWVIYERRVVGSSASLRNLIKRKREHE